MPTYETLNANGKSYIEFTPETGKAYKFSGLNQLADSHVYIIQSASTNSPGTHTVDPSEIRTVAQAITAGIVTKYDESAVTYFLEFANNYPVMVARITPVDALVDFESSSGLREDDLDVATGQALRVSQEAREVTERAGYRSVSATPETLGVFFGTDFVDSGDYWTFSGGYAGSIASDYLVFVDGELLAPSYLTAQTPDGTDGDFAVAKADYATPSEWHIVYIKDYISATLVPGPASVGTTELANLAVTTPKIALGAVDTDQLADESVTTAKIALEAVDTDQLADASVTADKIAPGAVPSVSTAPTGSVIAWLDATASVSPTGWLFCVGTAVSRTTYADLFAVIGTTYGIGDGTTTFNLPNFGNGEFLRGTGGNAAAMGTRQLDEYKSHSHLIGMRTSTYHNSNESNSDYKEPWSPGSGSDSTATSGGTETRPVNYSVRWLIKA